MQNLFFLLQFFRRKHKEEASKESSRHARDAVIEGSKMSRHSPEEPKQDEPSSVFSDGFGKGGKGGRSSYNMTTSLKTNVPGTCTDGTGSFTPSSEENGARTSLQTSPDNVDGDATLVGRSLPCMFFIFYFLFLITIPT